MTEAVFCKDCGFYKKDKRFKLRCYCQHWKNVMDETVEVSPYDPPCEEFKLGKGGEE